MLITFPKISSIYQNPFVRQVRKNNNLSGLQCDTVSFSGRKMLYPESMQDAPSEHTCRRASEYAEPARFYLKTVLEKYLTAEITANKIEDNPVESCTTRIKSPSSIREKVVSKYSKRFTDESRDFSNQLYDELSQYFKVNTDVDKSTIINSIENTIREISGHRKLLPYQNPSYYFMEIAEALRKLDYFDFESVEEQKIVKIFNEVIDSLENSAPENEIYVQPTDINGIKHYAQDIVGARILLKHPSPERTSLVITALKNAVNDGLLKIKSIESHIPDPEHLPKGKQMSDYIYATDAQLRSLAVASDAELIKSKSPSGYMAIHINIDLSNKLFDGKYDVFDGYSGEIQILGSDVEALKNVEDLCYKIKDNKNAINAGYKLFKDHFMKFYRQCDKDAFDAYTYAAFLAQRTTPYREIKSTTLPTTVELGFGGIVPDELDFNILKFFKTMCDKQVALSEKENRKSKEISASEAKKQLLIKDAKSLISYTIK